MTECPAFLFIFLPRSISGQRGPGRSPSPALRAPDLSRPPYRSEHLQNRRANAAPRIIKATIHLPAGRGRGSRPGLGGWGGGVGQTDPDDSKEFRETTLRHTNPCGPSGPRERKEKERTVRVCCERPSAAPRQAVAGSAWFQTQDGGMGGRQPKNPFRTLPHEGPHAHSQPGAVCIRPRPPSASEEQPSQGALTRMIIFDIINIIIISTPNLSGGVEPCSAPPGHQVWPRGQKNTGFRGLGKEEAK